MFVLTFTHIGNSESPISRACLCKFHRGRPHSHSSAGQDLHTCFCLKNEPNVTRWSVTHFLCRSSSSQRVVCHRHCWEMYGILYVECWPIHTAGNWTFCDSSPQHPEGIAHLLTDGEMLVEKKLRGQKVLGERFQGFDKLFPCTLCSDQFSCPVLFECCMLQL